MIYCLIYSISNILKGGLTNHWKRTYYYRSFGKDLSHLTTKPESSLESQRITSLNLKQFENNFTILAFGEFICLILNIIEWACYKYSISKRFQNNIKLVVANLVNPSRQL